MRLLHVWPAAAASIALAVAASAPAAQASPSPGWRVNDVISEPTELAAFDSVAANSQADAWAVGQNGYGPFLQHWNGHLWQDKTPPYTSLFTTSVSSTSYRDTWLLANLNSYFYALYWNGSRWAKFRFPVNIVLAGIVANGLRDVWVAGYKPADVPSGEAPYVAHYNGKSWHSLRTPDVPDAVSSLPGGEFSAIATVPNPQPFAATRYVVLQRVHRSWHSVPLPVLRLPKSQFFQPEQTLATSPENVWVDGNITNSRSEIPVRGTVLHWTGRHWHVYRSPVTSLGPLASDGHGGLWLASQNIRTLQSYFIRFSGGHWKVIAAPLPAPVEPGEIVSVSGIALIPGSGALWAVGTLAPSAHSGAEAIVYEYGP
jgi:hypothetical protein